MGDEGLTVGDRTVLMHASVRIRGGFFVDDVDAGSIIGAGLMGVRGLGGTKTIRKYICIFCTVALRSSGTTLVLIISPVFKTKVTSLSTVNSHLSV